MNPCELIECASRAHIDHLAIACGLAALPDPPSLRRVVPPLECPTSRDITSASSFSLASLDPLAHATCLVYFCSPRPVEKIHHNRSTLLLASLQSHPHRLRLCRNGSLFRLPLCNTAHQLHMLAHLFIGQLALVAAASSLCPRRTSLSLIASLRALRRGIVGPSLHSFAPEILALWSHLPLGTPLSFSQPSPCRLPILSTHPGPGSPHCWRILNRLQQSRRLEQACC
jgi:hypothetical protein